MFFLVKVVVSALIIAFVTELAKHYPNFGGIIAALPLVSLLSLLWLSFQGESLQQLSRSTASVLYGFPPTIALLVIIYFSLKASFPFPISIMLGILSWGGMLLIQKFFFNIIFYEILMFST